MGGKVVFSTKFERPLQAESKFTEDRWSSIWIEGSPS